jgi:long-chain acyl-CoA synthetase
MSVFREELKRAMNISCSQRTAFKIVQSGKLQEISYGKLREDVSNLCSQLQSMGIKSGMTAAMPYSNSYELMVIDLALIITGVKIFALPDDDSFSIENFKNNFNINFYISVKSCEKYQGSSYSAQFSSDLLSFEAHIINTDDIRDAKESVTYVFGSGTTGKPKCSEIILDNCLRDFKSFSDAFEINQNDSFFVFLPLSVLQQRVMIYSTLFRSGTVCLSRPNSMRLSLKLMQPTILVAPPLFYETLVSEFKKKIKVINGGTKRNLFRYLEGASEGSWFMRKASKVVGFAVKTALGGNIRFMLVGMAMSKVSTISFFNRCGLPIYEAYGLTETGVISINTPFGSKQGTVGKPLQPGTVVLSEKGEILIKRKDAWSPRYLNLTKEESDSYYPNESTFSTGDLGSFDEEGYLVLRGRIKTLLALSSGYKVQPEPVEVFVANVDGVGHAVLIGQGYPFLTIIVSLTEESNSKTKDSVLTLISKYNNTKVSRGRIPKTLFTNVNFNIENGLLNRSLKIDRNKVENYFSDDINAIYDHNEAVFEI